VQIHVAFTPRDAAPGRVQVVIDCIRATSTIAQALAAGYERVICVGEIADALRERAPRVVLGGEREGVRIDGFDLGNSPAEYEFPQGSTLVLTTTNGTRAILQAADEAEIVLVGAMSCLESVARAVARLAGNDGDVAIRCAGVRGEVALDDVYVAGRLVERIDDLAGPAFLTDAARSARAIARAYAEPLVALADSQSARDLDGTGHEADVAWCALESVFDIVPRVGGIAAGRAVIVT
jgi:2-phosphosulfolactate phosphatase